MCVCLYVWVLHWLALHIMLIIYWFAIFSVVTYNIVTFFFLWVTFSSSICCSWLRYFACCFAYLVCFNLLGLRIITLLAFALFLLYLSVTSSFFICNMFVHSATWNVVAVWFYQCRSSRIVPSLFDCGWRMLPFLTVFALRLVWVLYPSFFFLWWMYFVIGWHSLGIVSRFLEKMDLRLSWR